MSTETITTNPAELRYTLLHATGFNVEHARKCYDFIQGPADVETKPTTTGRPDGIYFVLNTPEGKVAKEYHTKLTNEQKAQCVGIGVQRNGLNFCVALSEYEDVELLPDGKKAKKRTKYLERECDALHDTNSEGNTRRLIEDNPALADVVGGGHIPALAVLVEMCYLRDEINQALAIVGGQPLRNTWYWSSTEYSQGIAWLVNFSSGDVNNYYKCYGGAVRAVAAF